LGLGFSLSSAQSGNWTFTIRANSVPSTGPDTTALVLQLVNNSSGVPGSTTLFPLTLSPSSPSGGFYTFTGSGSLSASTYWLVASTASSSTFFNWFDRGAYTESGAHFVGAKFDISDGSGWNSAADTLSVQIDVSPVPESSHSGLFAAFFLVACGIGHTVRRTNAISKLRALFN